MASTNTINTTFVNSTAPTEFLPENSRLIAIVFNNGPTELKLRFGVMADAQDYSVVVPTKQGYEIPKEFVGSVYGMWDAPDATNVAKVTVFK